MALELLLEVLSEEIPSGMQKKMAADLVSGFKSQIIGLWTLSQIESMEMISYVTPLRLVLHVKNITPLSKLLGHEIKGPKVGANNRDIDGFIKKNKITDIDQLYERDGVFYYKVQDTEVDTATVLSRIILTLLLKLPLATKMRWGDHRLEWVRPIKNILCLLDDKVLDFSFGHIQSSDNTGFIDGVNFIRTHINNPQDYFTTLLESGIILAPEERQYVIIEGAKKVADAISLSIMIDETLIDEIVGLVEKPNIFLGRISEKFMDLPPEVLITTLKHHQRYIMLCDYSGKLAPYFIIIANIKPIDCGVTIIAGNEKVVNARLSDAVFFVNNDKSKSLEEHMLQLSKLTFYRDAGNMLDKTERLCNISLILAEMMGIDRCAAKRAAMLAKADLVTEIVKELPELQGIIGYYYALYDGEDENIARAIKEHYCPAGPNDFVPTEPLSVLLAIADKLDNICKFFSMGVKPTGSKDPYALRRAALGIIRLICKNKLSISLCNTKLCLTQEVIDFISERLINFYENGYDKVFAHTALQR